MANLQINYLNRDYKSIKSDLQEYIKLYYPDQYADFSEASIGMMMLELNAYVGDILSYHVDNKFNELFLDTAQSRKSVIQLAKNLGYKVKGKTSSSVLIDFSITVEPEGDAPSPNYLLQYDAGMQLKSTDGTIFEVTYPIDFSSHYSMHGTRNRTIKPNFNSDNEIVSYTITKQELATAGKTEIFSKHLTSDIIKPFMSVSISDDVLEIGNAVTLTTSSPPRTEAEWLTTGNVWHEVSYLSDSKVFIETNESTPTNTVGHWLDINRRFISEYDELGNCSITFGSGEEDFNLFANWLNNSDTVPTITEMLNTDSLGVIPATNKWLHVRYRSGGGLSSNVAMNTITKVTHTPQITTTGSPLASPLNSVISSLVVNNPIPSIGGAEFETLNSIKRNAASHFAAQDRCVTLEDYKSKIMSMPPKYGSVYRAHATTNTDTDLGGVKIFLLSLNADRKLQNIGNELLCQNVASYLDKYRMINDFIILTSGQIINLGIDFTVRGEKYVNNQHLITQCILHIKNYMDINNWYMNDTLYISNISDILKDVPGVVNVVEVKLNNKFGGDYSNFILPSVNEDISYYNVDVDVNGEAEIIPTNNQIHSSPTSMFEIKFPDKDIKGRII
jgi:hypothetical protein